MAIICSWSTTWSVTLLRAVVAAPVMMKEPVQRDVKYTRSQRNPVWSEVVTHKHLTLKWTLYSSELSVQLMHWHSLPLGPLHLLFPNPTLFQIFLSWLTLCFWTPSKLNHTQILNYKLFQILKCHFHLLFKKWALYTTKNQIKSQQKFWKKPKKNHHNLNQKLYHSSTFLLDWLDSEIFSLWLTITDLCLFNSSSTFLAWLGPFFYRSLPYFFIFSNAFTVHPMCQLCHTLVQVTLCKTACSGTAVPH